MMIPTEKEIKKYELSSNDTKHFFDLIDISKDDYEIVYNTDNDGVYHVAVKFQGMGMQQVKLIMKVAIDQIQARISRQKAYEK